MASTEWEYETDDIARMDITLNRPATPSEGTGAVDELKDDTFGFLLMQWVIYDLEGRLAFADLSDSYLKLLKFSKDGGIPVRKVFPNSVAEKAGLKKWDVIRRINGVDVRFASSEEVYTMLSSLPRAVLRIVRDKRVEERMPQLTLSGAEDHMAEQGPDNPEDVDDIAEYMKYSTMYKLRSLIGYNRLEESVIPVAPAKAGLSLEKSEVAITIVANNQGLGISLKEWNIKDFDKVDMALDRREIFNELFRFTDTGCIVEGVISPAHEAGVQEMDVIIKVDDVSVTELSPEELLKSHLTKDQGVSTTIVVLRADKIKEKYTQMMSSQAQAAQPGSYWGSIKQFGGMLDSLKVADTSSTMAMLRSQGVPSFQKIKEGFKEKVTQLSEAPVNLRIPVVPIPLPSFSWMTRGGGEVKKEEGSSKVLLEGKYRADVVFINIKRGAQGFGFMPMPWTTQQLHHAVSFQFSAWDKWRKLFHFAPDGGLPVRGVFFGSEAQKAGLQRWDVIQYIEGEDVREEPMGVIVELVKGTSNEVRLKVLRDPNAESIARAHGLDRYATPGDWFDVMADAAALSVQNKLEAAGIIPKEEDGQQQQQYSPQIKRMQKVSGLQQPSETNSPTTATTATATSTSTSTSIAASPHTAAAVAPSPTKTTNATNTTNAIPQQQQSPDPESWVEIPF